MTKMLAWAGCGALLLGVGVLTGCDEADNGRVIDHRAKVEVKDGGAEVHRQEETVRQRSDGAIIKEKTEEKVDHDID